MPSLVSAIRSRSSDFSSSLFGRKLAASMGLCVAMAVGPAQAVTSTWGGGTGVWSSAAGWSTNPLYPCNGQGGNNYDVVLGTGTVTQDVSCTIDSLSQTGGVLAGSLTLEVLGGLSWTIGTMNGSGTTRVGGGLNASSGSTKNLADTRTLVQSGGTGTWSLGAINLGAGGATVRNEATWNLTGTTRSMLDTLNTGRFENAPSGILNVNLSTAVQTVTISTGTTQNEGIVNLNAGILAFGGSGTHTGSFVGASTMRLSGGTQTLGAGASVTVADFEIAAATLNVNPGASYAPGNTDLSTSGILNVTGAADTVSTGTATLSGGTIGGPGTFQTTGSLEWTFGTMNGSGTTRVGGGLNASTGSTKNLANTRTLVLSGGTGTWSLGAINLGAGGATIRNEATWNLTGAGRSMLDTGNTGRFENAPSGILNVDLSTAGQTVTISTGTTQNEGIVNSNVGILAFGGSGTHTGSFAGASTMRLSGGTQTLGAGASVTVADFEIAAATLNVNPGASYAPGNTDLSTSGILNVTDAADTVSTGTATLNGGTIGGPGTFQTTGSLEWTFGTMNGSGTTRVGGGLNASSGSTKTLANTRTLVQSGGAGTWSAGAINLGGGGATIRNEATWNLTGTGRSMLDTGNTGRFENAPSGILNVDLSTAGQTVTISTGAVRNEGRIAIRLGSLSFPDEFRQTAGATRLEGGVLTSTTLLDFQGGSLEGTGLVNGDVAMAGTLSPGLSPGLAAGQLDIDGDLTLTGASSFQVELLGPTRGTEYDSATVVDNVVLGGALSVDVLASFRDSVPATPFIVLEDSTGGALGGSFANVANGERVFTSMLDSFVVRYGAGSAFGSDRVVLTDYVKYMVVSTLQVVGTSAGGTVSVDVGGILVDATLPAGLSASQVAAAIAAAINASSQLRQLGVAASATGMTVATNGTVGGFTNSDPGIVINPLPGVPGLSPLALVLLATLLGAIGLGSVRRIARSR